MFVRQSIIGTGVSLAGKLTGLAVTVVLAKAMDVSQFGLYSYCLAWITLLALPANYGLSQLTIREVAKSKKAESLDALAAIQRFAEYIAGGITVAVMVFILLSVVPGFSFAQSLANTSPILIVSLLIIPALVMTGARSSVLLGLGNYIAGQFFEGVFRPLLVASLCVAAYLVTSSHVSALQALLMLLIAYLATWVTTNYVLTIMVPRSVTTTKLRIEDVRLWLKALLPLTLIGALQQINQSFDLIMLEYFGSIAEVGVYKVASALGLFVAFGLRIISPILSPRFVTAYTQSNLDELQRLATFGAVFSFAFALIVGFCFLALGSSLLSFVFGEAYAHGNVPLNVISIAHILNAFFGVTGTIMIMVGKESVSLVAVGLSVVANVLLNLILIPLYGASGAAVASAVSVITWNVYMWHYIYRELSIDSTVMSFRRTFLDR